MIDDYRKTKGERRRRLLKMGFAKGASGRMLREAVLKDSIEVELGGNSLSLRRAEAADIIVKDINEHLP